MSDRQRAFHLPVSSASLRRMCIILLHVVYERSTAPPDRATSSSRHTQRERRLPLRNLDGFATPRGFGDIGIAEPEAGFSSEVS